VADEPVIKRFGVRLETRTSRVTRRDYDPHKARLLLESQARGEQLPDLEDYDYPGRFTDRSRGKHLAQRSLERHRSDYRQATGHQALRRPPLTPHRPRPPPRLRPPQGSPAAGKPGPR